ncbi:unnamed protein product, partial [Ranitomeya imitator]
RKQNAAVKRRQRHLTTASGRAARNDVIADPRHMTGVGDASEFVKKTKQYILTLATLSVPCRLVPALTAGRKVKVKAQHSGESHSGDSPLWSVLCFHFTASSQCRNQTARDRQLNPVTPSYMPLEQGSPTPVLNHVFRISFALHRRTMSDFVESEAEESEEEYNNEGEVVQRSSKKFVEDDDDEEEEDENPDDQDEQGNLKDFINDDDDEDEEEEEQDAGSESGGSDDEIGHKTRKRTFDDRLEDEDFDLIEENLGVKVKRQKFRRVKKMSDDEDDEEDAGKEEHEKEAIAEEIFQDGEDEDRHDSGDQPVIAAEEEEEEEDEESDIDDFIVDDDGQPLKKPKWRKKLPGYADAVNVKKTNTTYLPSAVCDVTALAFRLTAADSAEESRAPEDRHGSALQEAQEIFGVDFDYEEFEKYNEDDEEMEEYEYEDEEAEGETRVRPKKTAKKRVSRRSIFEIYEPSELESSHLTDQDNEIRTTDLPERFQLRTIPVKAAEDEELEEEADWIYRNAFSTPTISQQESCDYLERGQVGSNFGRKGPSTIQKIREALNFMRNQHFEVPFIAFYRKEYVEPELNINDLWRVWQWDEKSVDQTDVCSSYGNAFRPGMSKTDPGRNALP